MVNTHMKTMFKNCTLLMGMTLAAFQALAQSGLLPEANRDFAFDYSPIQPRSFASFAEAAAWADVVAIAQVTNIDYLQTRELNASGQGFLTVRVPYKGVKKNEMLIVSSKGFEDHVCYYPDREGEGQRYLVFLKKAANEGEYHGYKPFCQLQVLLTDTGEYALRYPQDLGFELDPSVVRELQFNDPHSEIDATDWTNLAREEHQQKYGSVLREDSDMFQKFFYLSYTRGIMIYDVRKLMQLTTQQRIHSDQI
jgi:hypothetical protein